MNTLILKSELALKQWVAQWLPNREPAQVVLLNGPMGAGKTRLVQMACEVLGGGESSSPSFSIHNEYAIAGGVVDHLDLYRIESEDELESTGFWDLFEKQQGLIFIEWAERLGTVRFSRHWSVVCIQLEYGQQEGERRLSVEVVK